jgi:hypothetical protein
MKVRHALFAGVLQGLQQFTGINTKIALSHSLIVAAMHALGMVLDGV